MTSIRRVVLVSLFSVFLPWVSLAAQNGRVVTKTAIIREQPDHESQGLAQARQGDILRIASKSRLDWFRVLIPGTQEAPQYGWVSAQELIPLDLIHDLKEAKIQSGNTRYLRGDDDDELGEWSLALYYQLTTVNPHDVQGFVGLTNQVDSVSTFAGEVNLSPSQWVGLSFYFSALSDSGSNGLTSYSLSTFIMGGLVEYYPLKVSSIRLGFGLGVIGVPVWMKVTRPSDTVAGATVSGSQKFITAGSLFRLNFREYFTKHMGVGLNAGYRFIYQKSIGIADSRTNLHMSGLFGEVGVFYEF